MLQFLLEKFQEGKAIGTIHVYKAALSGLLDQADGFKIGAHPHVVDLVKGMANQKPKQYKTFPPWKVDKVLDLLKGWGDNTQLDIRHITLKTAMLLALTSGARCCELANLDTGHMHNHEGMGI